MNHYTYAQLGTNCRASMNVLTSNRKFLPPNYERYNLVYTNMSRYPAERNNFLANKNNKNFTKPTKTYEYSNCCGHK